ncbi:hypothetical protein V5N11_024793 [Cardamine amara subsp. amara]|uniref:RING-CH-type domain-containing protein n=1 Tax=Cardamine amara subsp. amara TaxID=228776 RepID=A0ABD1ADV2_CARAN
MESVQSHLDTLVSVKVIHGSSSGSENNREPRRSSVAVEEDEEIVKDEERRSNASVCSVEVDLELGEKAVHLSQSERDCRICHMSLDAANLESGVPIELGCSCKADLAAAHKHCAETWFKIKGNKICEVCGSIAGNVVGTVEVESEENNETNGVVNQALRTSGPRLVEGRSFWQGHRFLNFLLACMVFAFVISWLFHFNVPST